MKRKLVVCLIVLSIPTAWMAWQFHVVVSEGKAIKAMLDGRNGRLSDLPPLNNNKRTLPWYRVFLGDTPTAWIYVDGDEFTQDEIDRIEAAYPEAEFLIVVDRNLRRHTYAHRLEVPRHENWRRLPYRFCPC